MAWRMYALYQVSSSYMMYFIVMFIHVCDDVCAEYRVFHQQWGLNDNK